MSEFNWKSVVEQIKNGESVDESVSNRALVALSERTEWLKARIEQLDTTSGRVSLSSVPIDPTVSGGDWVYHDPVDDVYKGAVAGLEWDDSLKTYVPTTSSLVCGLVVDKISPVLAVILVLGAGVNLPGEPDIANMDSLMQEGESFTPGRCFLSSTSRGKMTRFPSGAPLIPLGIFDTENSTIRPDIRDAFDSHYHRRFELHAMPAGSNNLLETGWGEDGSIGWVDHYHLTGEDSSVIALAHRRNATKLPMYGQRRIDLSKDAGTGKLKVTLHTDVDPDDPTSVDTSAASKVLEWPAYGEEVVVDWPSDGIETDLVFAFIRRDWSNAARYDNPLSVDVAGLPTSDTGGTWKVNLPTDFKGWANANPFRDDTPSTARLRYVTEGHHDLFESFPPVPAEGAILYKDGATAVVNTDYRFSHFDLFWIDNSEEGDASSGYPWPWDFSRSATYTGSKHLHLAFVQNPLGPTETVVKCLKSVSSLLEITGMGGDQVSSTGALQIALKLALAIKDGDPVVSETSLTAIDGESRFIVGNSVAELVAGPNTKLVKINKDESEDTVGPFIGKVRVEAVLPTMQGESVGIALFNAKESEKNGVIYTEFLRPTVAKTAMAARIKIPNFDRGTNNIRFRLHGRFMGEVTSSGATQGIFKVDYRIIREGVNVSSGLTTPVRTEGWQVDFPDAYVPFTILSNELPVYGPSGSETFRKQPAEVEDPGFGEYNLFADDLLEPNDIVSVRIERLANSSPFQVGDAGSLSANTLGADNYQGNIGLVGLRWVIDLT